MQKLIAQSLTALRFFSIYPVPLQPFEKKFNNEQPMGLNEAAPGYSIAGLLIAIIPAAIWYFASLSLSPLLAATVAIAAGMFVTGAMHEDGLADCFDGLGGGSNRERVLEIMRDSSIGTYGASALLFTVAIRIMALASLEPWIGVLALFIAHSLARSTMTLAIHGENYARPQGMADIVSQGIDLGTLISSIVIAQIIVIVLVFIGGGWEAIWVIPIGLAAAWLFLRWLVGKIGGYTGDGLGAMEQFSEMAILVSLSVFWS